MIFSIFHIFGSTCVWLMLKIFTKLEIDGLERLKDAEKPVIVIGNHESNLDPTLIGIVFLHKPRLFPIRFMAKNEFFAIPGFNLLIYILGSFKSNNGKGLENSLKNPFHILRRKGTVMMFPEGRIVPERGVLGRGRRGAAALAIMSGSGILPMSIHTPHNLTPWRMVFTRRSSKLIKVNIGEVFYLDNVTYPDISDETTSRATEEVMSEIRKLYSQHRYE